MQTVLVAGGAGFIGSQLCEKLLFDGFKVICIDNLITSDEKNIRECKRNKAFQFIEQDIVTIKPDEPFPDIHYIFHLASPASPNKNSKRSYINFPIETMLVNSQGTYNLLLLAQSKNARFLYASTSEIYGDPAISPQPETYFGNVNPNGIRSVYDESKRYGEALTMTFTRKFGLDCRIVRIFNTYGPKMQADDGRVVSNFITQALKKQPLTIYGKGEQTRSFCYVTDMIDGLQKMMFSEGNKGEVVNLGNPVETSILDFATIISELTNLPLEFTYDSLPEDDPKQRRPDITKAIKILHWEPVVSLRDGISETIEYFKNLLIA